MKILAIETSCDETAIALVEAKGGFKNPSFKILENLVASQVKIHQPFGGVVPILAKQAHLKNLPILSKKIKNSGFKFQEVNLIAVTIGPGLEPCLWAGINFAKEIQKKVKNQKSNLETTKQGRKITGINHLEGHLYSFLLSLKTRSFKSSVLNFQNIFPAIALIISGGHTILLLMKDLIHYKKLGETRDDAVGESFDKVARLLGFPYPGGPEIEKIASQRKNNQNLIEFPRPMINQRNYEFSFSGLKTAVLYYIRQQFLPLQAKDVKNLSFNLNNEIRSQIAASFQSAVFDVLITKTLRAVKEYKTKSIIISGGVAVNKNLQKQFRLAIKNWKLKVDFLVPSKIYCTDNAAMIAAASYINYLQNKKHKLTAQGGLSI